MRKRGFRARLPSKSERGPVTAKHLYKKRCSEVGRGGWLGRWRRPPIIGFGSFAPFLCQTCGLSQTKWPLAQKHFQSLEHPVKWHDRSLKTVPFRKARWEQLLRLPAPCSKGMNGRTALRTFPHGWEVVGGPALSLKAPNIQKVSNPSP